MYILKNLRSLIENSRLIFILIIICITVSTLVIQFSYGIYQNYHVVIEQGESEYKQINIEFDNKLNDYVKLFQVLECISQFSPELYENINYCSIGQDQDSFRSSYGIKEITDDDDPTTDPAKTNYFYVSFDDNGNLTDCKTIKSNFINNKFMEGRWFKEDEWGQGKKVCLVGLGGGIQRIAPFVDENHKPLYNISHDGIVEQNSYTDEFGDTYEVIGITQIGTSVFPIYSVNQNYRIDIFYFELFQPITAEQYKELSEILESKLGHYVQMPDVEFSESKNIYLYKTILIICGLVSLAAGINFIILFQFIMMKRQKKLAIYRLCGCTYFKCVRICLLECLILTIPLYVLFTFIYDKIIVSAFSNIYPYMESANSFKIYTVLGALYIGITTMITFIMLIKNINKSIVSIQKGRN